MSTLDFSGYSRPEDETNTQDAQVTPPANVGGELDFSGYSRPETKEFEATNLDSKYSYDQILNDDSLKAMAVRFAKDHLGHKRITEQDAVDEFIEHFRQMSVNEVFAGMDYNYVSGLAADAPKSAKKQQQLDDYRTLYTVFEKMPSFYEKGGTDASTALLDYVVGTALAPSTYLSLLVPAGGKVAGQAAVATSKLGLGRLLAATANNPLKATAALEGLGGALQDVGEQNVRLELDLQEKYNFGRTALASAVAAGTSVGIPIALGKRKIVKQVEKNTGEIVEQSYKAIGEKKAKAQNNADDTIAKNKKLSDSVSEQLNALNLEMYKAGKEKLGEMATEEKLAASVRLAVQPEKFKQVTGALTEVLQQVGGLEPGERIMEGLARAVRQLKQGDVPGSEKARKDLEKAFGDIINKYDLTYDDIANIFIADASDNARMLQAAGQAKKDVTSAMKRFSSALDEVTSFDIFGFDRELKEVSERLSESVRKGDMRGYLTQLDVAEKGAFAKAHERFKRADAARLAFMTSQTATTVRNMVSGYSRVGIDVLTRSLDNGMAKVTGVEKFTPNSDEWAVVYGLMNKKEAALVEEIFELGFEDRAGHLFRQLADISDATGKDTIHKVGRLEKVSRELNALNTISDNMFKRAAFVGNLKRELNDMYGKAAFDAKKFINEFGVEKYNKEFGKPPSSNDYNLIEIIKNGNFNKVFGTEEGKKALDRVIEDTLYFTFQKSPDNETVRGLIQGIHNAPFMATALVPFPRFMYNAMRFTYEYSPIFLLKNQEARSQFFNASKGTVNLLTDKVGLGKKLTVDESIRSYNEAAKGLVGLGMLAGATAFRLSENAGERWYEYQTDSGKTFSMLPFFPAPPYLFFGDLIARTMKGEPVFKNNETLREALSALTGAQFKAGLGLYALEKGVEDLTDPDLSLMDKAGLLTAEYVGNLISTATIPLTFAQDVDTTFFAPDEERVIREADVKNFWELLVYRSMSRVPRAYTMEKLLEEATGDFTGYKAPIARQETTKEGKRRRVAPITRQTAGLLMNEKKNAFEKELERLKIRKFSVLPRTRNVEYNEMYGKIMDHYIANVMVPYINSDEYKNLKAADLLIEGRIISLTKNERQEDALKEKLGEIKTEIQEGLQNQKTRINMLTKYDNYPKDVLDFERMRKNVRQLAKATYAQRHGAVNSKKEYDYHKLLLIAKEIEAKYPENFVIE